MLKACEYCGVVTDKISICPGCGAPLPLAIPLATPTPKSVPTSIPAPEMTQAKPRPEESRNVETKIGNKILIGPSENGPEGWTDWEEPSGLSWLKHCHNCGANMRKIKRYQRTAAGRWREYDSYYRCDDCDWRYYTLDMM
jgi:hypothetical protein